MEQTLGRQSAPSITKQKKLGVKNWFKAAMRTKRETRKDHIGIVAAGVAFFVFLGVFPLAAVFISVYGMVASPDDVVSAMASFEGVIPTDIVNVMASQLNRLIANSEFASKAAIVSTLVAVWSGSKAIKGMMGALNIVNGRVDERHFLVKAFVSMGLTFGGILLGTVCVLLLGVIPALAYFFKITGPLVILVHIVRWALLALTVVTGLSVLYRFGPDRRGERWKWLTPGAIIATATWLIVSGLFSWFVSNFGNYDKTYGSLGTIAILLLWLSLSAYVFITGAEFDAEIRKEKQALT